MLNDKKIIDFVNGLGKKIDLKSSKIISSQFKDIKLEEDIFINDKIVEFLEKNFPYQILSEESNNQKSFTSYKSPIWIIDPLDGSFNFSRGIPHSCISISLYHKRNILFGCVYDFYNNSFFTTTQYRSVSFSVSKVSSIKDGVLCTGFPSWRNYETDSLSSFVQKIKDWKKIRAIGSAAISLTWVARGYVDAYIEEDIKIWDVAAGLSLVEKAGGKIYYQENEKPNFVTAIATNGLISIEELL